MEKDLRERILDASVALVAERGVHALSFREVARRAGVSHQAPYHHFKNRLGILQAIAGDGFVGLTATLQAAVARAGDDPIAALKAAGLAYVAYAVGHPGHVRVMFDEAIVTAEAAEALPHEADPYIIVRRLAQDVHEAGLAPGIDPETLAHLCWSTVHGLAGLIVDGVLPKKAADPDRAAENVIAAMVRVLVPPDRDPGSD